MFCPSSISSFWLPHLVSLFYCFMLFSKTGIFIFPIADFPHDIYICKPHENISWIISVLKQNVSVLHNNNYAVLSILINHFVLISIFLNISVIFSCFLLLHRSTPIEISVLSKTALFVNVGYQTWNRYPRYVIAYYFIIDRLL